jgi:hypothetical protein
VLHKIGFGDFPGNEDEDCIGKVHIVALINFKSIPPATAIS